MHFDPIPGLDHYHGSHQYSTVGLEHDCIYMKSTFGMLVFSGSGPSAFLASVSNFLSIIFLMASPVKRQSASIAEVLKPLLPPRK